MKNTGSYEDIIRGNDTLPIAFHYVDNMHPRYNMNLHWHIDTEIIFILEGEFSLQVNDVIETFHEGDIVYLPKNTLHGGTPHNCVYHCIIFNEKLLFKSSPALLEAVADFSASLIKNDDTALSAILNILNHSNCKDKQDMFLIYSNLHLLYSRLFNATGIGAGNDSRSLRKIEKIKKAIELIEKHYNEPLTLSMLSKQCNMSEKYFCSFFKTVTGKTPFEYLCLYRVDTACELLLSDKYTITEISMLCGFNDLSYFIKTFKRYKHISPGKYITQNRSITN